MEAPEDSSGQRTLGFRGWGLGDKVGQVYGLYRGYIGFVQDHIVANVPDKVGDRARA